jgi:Arc/MetJ-type ribon-helix-helix transcriptional regulator
MAGEHIVAMAATVAMPQKKLLRRLMKSGRWNSESEIVRYGIELVRREMERDQLSPYPESVLAEAYSRISDRDRTDDERLGRASALPTPDELR